MLKYWRILILLTCVIGAILAIGLKAYPYGRNGVEVVYVTEQSPAKGILEQGMIITEVDGEQIKDVDEWRAATKDLTGSVEIKANGKDHSIFVNDTLGIDVMPIERTNMEMGLDLRGGTRILLKPEENVSREMITQIISTLQTRSNIYGLKEIKLYPIGGADGWYVQLEAAGVGSEVVDDLLSRQGSFEAKVYKPVDISQNRATMVLGSEKFDISMMDDSVVINGTTISPNQTFNLAGVEFQYLNRTQSRLSFMATVFTGEDIELVYTDPQHSGLSPRAGGIWSFYFAVLVSEKGAQRFAAVTTGIPKHLDIQVGEEYLDSKLYLYLDEQLVSELNIAAELGGTIIQSPSIQGSRLDRDEAVEEKLRLQTILRSGALPTTLETASVNIISPTLGAGFIGSAAIAAVLGALAVVVVVMFRYRSFRVAIPLVLTALSEIVIILGIAATNDYLIWGTVLMINACIVLAAWFKQQEIDAFSMVGAILIPLLGFMSWTIDLPAIGGIIAAIGTGVDHQIIIADETTKRKKEEKVYTVKEKIKRAFFIIFGAAATTIAAMLPLMFLGVGLVRGFAITTIIGVLVGTLITRPAYAKVIEVLRK